MSPVSEPALLVLAKEPRVGRVKTRLCPRFSPSQATEIAMCCLLDTLDVVVETTAARRVLVLDGAPGAWLPPGIEVIPQRGSGLDARLSAAFADAGAPALLVGMDTPQITGDLLAEGLQALADGADCVLGPTEDGGYWAIGLREPCAGVFGGVPMSTPWTLEVQRRRLDALGLSRTELPTLRDVDRAGDAEAVAPLAPRSRFAAALDAVEAVV